MKSNDPSSWRGAKWRRPEITVAGDPLSFSPMKREDSTRANIGGQAMVPVISLFNHKGGVSKTTTTFNLGWALAVRGHRVLIVDGDPQCNLTGTVLGFDGVNDFSKFYEQNPGTNISAALEPVFKATGVALSAAPVVKTPHANLFLLPGNIDLAENETQVSVALSTSPAIPALQNIPGSLAALLRMTAKENTNLMLF